MTITGYKGKDKEVEIKKSYRPLIFSYDVVEIAANAFNGLDENGEDTFNKQITSVIIAESVTKIGNKAFANCTNLQNAKVLNQNCDIANDAFEINISR